MERAYIERNGCPFAIGEDKLPEKLLELKRNVGNHYEDFDLWWWYLFCAMYLQILQQIESEQNLLLEIQSFNNTEALLDVVKTDSEIKLIFWILFLQEAKLME